MAGSAKLQVDNIERHLLTVRCLDGVLNDLGSQTKGTSEYFKPNELGICTRDPHIKKMTSLANNSRVCSTSSDAVALETWENEGGAMRAPSDGQRGWHKPVSQREAYVLQHLGAALLSQWNSLPPRIQHELFEHSVVAAASDDATGSRKRIAQFLHEHKDDGGRGVQ